jgi:hypothetical protein
MEDCTVEKTLLLGAFLTAILICGLVLASAMRFGPVQASTAVSGIPKPSVPEFTLKLVKHPYDVPPTYEIDPYTGENVMTAAGYHVENKSIEITITNQPFTGYELDNGRYCYLFYNISYKGSYEKDWKYYSYNRNTEWFFSQSLSEYTVISFYGIPTKGSMDFRVQAQIGYYTEYRMPWTAYNFTGETSGWSETQTITIEESQMPTPPPSTTPTPTLSPARANYLQPQAKNLNKQTKQKQS